ncbi:TIM barrel protein [bacterium]|nr:TIM barrel protein [bacterium]
MKLGFVSAILPDLSLEQVLKFAADEKFSCVEVMCWPAGKAERKYAGITHIDVTNFKRGDVAGIHDLIAKHGVEISALGYYPNPLDPDRATAAKAVAHIKKVIRASALLGIKHMNTFIGRDWTKSVDDNWPRFLKTWKPIVQLAEDLDVKIGIENCAMLFTNDEWPGGKNLAFSLAIWRRMFNDIPSKHFGLNYDPSHLVWMQMDWEKPLHEFSDRLHHLHAKDVRLNHDALDDVGILAPPLEYHQPRIPGFGEIDWGRYLGTVKEIGYKGPVCIEVEDDTFGKTLKGRKEAVRVAGNVLRPYF